MARVDVRELLLLRLQDVSGPNRAKPMTATATAQVHDIWQQYFAATPRPEEAADVAAADAGAGRAREVHEVLFTPGTHIATGLQPTSILEIARVAHSNVSLAMPCLEALIAASKCMLRMRPEEDDEATVEDALAVPVSSPAIVPKRKAAKQAPSDKAEWVSDVASTHGGTKFYWCEPSSRC